VIRLACFLFATMTLLGLAPLPQASATTVLSDPEGDVFLFNGSLPSGSPPAPDIVEVTAGFSSENLVFTIDFATGTLGDSLNGLAVMGLDLDLDAGTGGSFIPGADRLLFFSGDLSFLTVCEEIVPFPVGCGSQLSITEGTDSLAFEVPLDLPDINDDGEVRFGFVIGLFDGGVPVSEDAAFGGPAGSLERNLQAVSSAVVPEPSTAVLVAMGLTVLGAHRSRP